MTSPLVRRKRLAAELRALRERADLTTEQLGKRIGFHRLKISRLEAPTGRPSVRDVMKVLDELQVHGDHWHQIVQLAHDAAKRGWWEEYGADMGARQPVYANLESGAATIREYRNDGIPCLLQTTEYLRVRGDAEADSDRAVEARKMRQRMMCRPDGPTYAVIVEEVALRRTVAPVDVLAAQLRHLVEVATLPTVEVRVLPVAAEIGGANPRSAYVLYTYPDPGDPVVVAVDTETADLVLTGVPDVAHYNALHERLAAAALSAERSAEFLTAMATGSGAPIGSAH